MSTINNTAILAITIILLSITITLTILTLNNLIALRRSTALLLSQGRKLSLHHSLHPLDEEAHQPPMTTPETPAGPPPMAWQADYGLVPQMGQPPPPPYMPMAGGGGGAGMMMPGMVMNPMWPASNGAMNAEGGMGEPKPTYLPPGPMPYGGFGGYGMGGWGMGAFGAPPLGIPGVDTRGPKGFSTINLLRLTGSSSRQRAKLASLLTPTNAPAFDFEIYQFPSTDNVGEFLEAVGANKERYRVTEIRETGGGGWERGLTVKWKDEPGRLRRLEGIGWGGKAGMGTGKVVWVVVWKKAKSE